MLVSSHHQASLSSLSVPEPSPFHILPSPAGIAPELAVGATRPSRRLEPPRDLPLLPVCSPSSPRSSATLAEASPPPVCSPTPYLAGVRVSSPARPVGDGDAPGPLDRHLIQRPGIDTDSGWLLVADQRAPLVSPPAEAPAPLGRPNNRSRAPVKFK